MPPPAEISHHGTMPSPGLMKRPAPLQLVPATMAALEGPLFGRRAVLQDPNARTTYRGHEWSTDAWLPGMRMVSDPIELATARDHPLRIKILNEYEWWRLQLDGKPVTAADGTYWPAEYVWAEPTQILDATNEEPPPGLPRHMPAVSNAPPLLTLSRAQDVANLIGRRLIGAGFEHEDHWQDGYIVAGQVYADATGQWALPALSEENWWQWQIKKLAPSHFTYAALWQSWVL